MTYKGRQRAAERKRRAKERRLQAIRRNTQPIGGGGGICLILAILMLAVPMALVVAVIA